VINAKVVIAILTTSPGQSSPANNLTKFQSASCLLEHDGRSVDRQESELYFSLLMAHDNEEAKVEYELAFLLDKFGRFDIAAARWF
jgi:hypothetical protein